MIQRVLRLLLPALFLAACAAAAAEPPPPVLSLSTPSAVSPDFPVEVRWPPLPADAEEYELLLRYEAPLRLTLRLTDSRDPSARGFLWRVPNLPPGRAHLVLRAGRRRAEVEWGRSAPFAVRGDPSAPTQRAEWRRDELWVLEGSSPAGPALLLPAERPSWSAPGGLPAPADGPAPMSLLPRPARGTRLARDPAPPTRGPARAAPSRAPQRRVLRV